MYWGIIHRTILWESLKIFFLALVALTGMILMAGIISEAMRNGFGPAQILSIIPLLLPSLLPYTVPTTTLFTTCIVYGRLSADNEILALKAAGIHIIHVIWPALFLGMVTSAATMICYIDLIPYTGSLMRNKVVGDIEDLLYMMLRKDGFIKHPRINWEIHVKTIQGRKLQDVIFMRKSADGKKFFDTIARAREAELRVDIKHNKILVDMRQCNIEQAENGMVGFVESQIWPVDVPEGFAGSDVKFRAMDMTWNELGEYEEKLQADKEKLGQEIALLQASLNLGSSEPNAAKDLQHYSEARKQCDSQICSIHSEYHMRPALSLGCLCFALVGCPVGIWFSKSDYLSAFVTCFLPIVIIYYPLLFCMFNMARAGKLEPALGIYNADLLMLSAGAILFRRLARN